MTSADVVIRIANLSQALVGHIRGGLAQVVTVFSMFFADMSGSTSADVAVLSRTMAKPMEQEGYGRPFIAALIASASTIACLVPPSNHLSGLRRGWQRVDRRALSWPVSRRPSSSPSA